MLKEKVKEYESRNPLAPYWTYLKDHFKKDYHPGYYWVTALFLVVTIYLNYQFNFKKLVVDSYYGSEISVLYYLAFYSFPYLSILFLYVHVFKQYKVLQSRKLWLLVISGLVISSIDSGFYYHYSFAYSKWVPSEVSYFFRKCTYNLRSLITVILPLVLLHKYYFKHQTFYGLSFKNVDLKPYFLMLIIMLPLITWASFLPDFLKQYPTLRSSEVNDYLNLPSWLTALVYEICYGWDFVVTELMFRGFFVIGMVSVLGRGAILPMVVFYAFIHFGKPLGETIGSIFGGYILGVIALYSRNIWGGVIIHLGVAWLMELAAYLQSVEL